MSTAEGRRKNGALPVGKHDATKTEEEAVKTGKESTRRAGPDGPDAREVGDTFKRRPGDA